jgi:N-acetylneuraminate synthase
MGESLLTSKTESPFASSSLDVRREPLLLAEMGQFHEGSLVLAQTFFDLAADAGADAVKVQIHFPETEATLDEPFRVQSGTGDKTRYDYWMRTSFSREQWESLREYARDLGLLFIPSTFSLEALEFAVQLESDALKVGSAEVLQPWFLEAVSEKQLPTILSSGMSTWKEIQSSIDHFSDHSNYLALLQCTSVYPSSLRETGPALVPQLKERFGIPSGLSDHSGRTSPSLLALALGADIVEVHVTIDKAIKGFDSSSSVTFSELRQIVDFKRAVVGLRSSIPDKDAIAERLIETRRIFGRSISPSVPIPAGAAIERRHLLFKKPGGGIPPEDVGQVIGRVARQDLDPRKLIHWENLI